MPCCILLFEWFQARRGLAAGIMYAGTGVGGTIFPFLITGLISKVGYRAAMCSIGIAFLAFGCLALIPIKRRVPLPRKARLAGEGDEMDGQAESMRVARPNLSFMRRPQVWIGAGIIMVSSMGTFVPTLWLPCESFTLVARRIREGRADIRSVRRRSPGLAWRYGLDLDHEW
jgi:MFS family permease